jgi:hypothetical protein
MRKSTFSLLTVIVLSSITLLQSCKDDSVLLNKTSVPDQSFSEDFDTASAALSRGWRFINTSDPIGSGVWQQGGGVPPWFNAWSSHGSYVGFIGADYTSTSAAAGIISNYVVSPAIWIQNGDKIIFYTRGLLYDAGTGGDSTDYSNRLQVLINTTGDNTTIGTGLDQGNFDKVLLDINPGYAEYHTTTSLNSPLAYPSTWTRFEATVVGLNGAKKGRFAFRYFVEGAGFNGLGSGVAIDKVSYVSVNHQ